jgi:hypothetical protein
LLPRLQSKLLPGNRVRIRVTRESRELGYHPCPDNSIAIFVKHIEIHGREFAEVRLMSMMSKLRISYEHIVEIVNVEYEVRRGELIELLSEYDTYYPGRRIEDDDDFWLPQSHPATHIWKK